MKLRRRQLSRRQFIEWGALAAAPAFIPGRVLGLDPATPPPSEVITMAAIGWGMQGPGNTMNFASHDDCRVLAVCDVDKSLLAAGVNAVNAKYQTQDCKGYADYREVLARTDIDTVMLALPDHWHALVAVAAARARKDIWGEKPLAKTIREQQAIVKAVKAANIVWQTGSWQRSVQQFRLGAELVRNGVIGKVTRVEVGLPAGHNDFTGQNPSKEEAPVPPDLDYEAWIGPATLCPYVPAKVHRNWRWNYNTGGGQLLDWIGHHGDIAHWGMDWDNTGPSRIKPEGAEFPPADAVWNTATKFRVEATYPGNIPVVISGGHPDIRGGTKWIGTDGWIWVDRSGIEASNPEMLKPSYLPDDQRKVKLYVSKNHFRNFLDCVKSRKPTITPVEVAHRSAVPGHLAYIALKLNRPITWDPKREVIVGDPEAARLAGRDYRAPYRLA